MRPGVTGTSLSQTFSCLLPEPGSANIDRKPISQAPSPTYSPLFGQRRGRQDRLSVDPSASSTTKRLLGPHKPQWSDRQSLMPQCSCPAHIRPANPACNIQAALPVILPYIPTEKKFSW